MEKKGESERNNAKIINTFCKVEKNSNRINLRKKGQSLTNKDKRDFNVNNFMGMQDDYHAPK